MKKVKQTKKTQSLPLNTIVIAILVIIVLLVIIIFFTSKMGESGTSLNNLKGCDLSNPLIASDKYVDVYVEKIIKGATVKCPDNYPIRIMQVTATKNEEGETLICCGKKNEEEEGNP